MVNLRTGHRRRRYVFTGIFRPKSGFVTGNGCLARKPHDGTMSLRDKHAFRLLLGGSTVSMLGSRVSTIAYPMLVLHLTGSPVYAGFAVFAAAAPSILVYIPAGALVDRWDPWQTMMVSEIGRGLAIAGVVGALAFHWRSAAMYARWRDRSRRRPR
jgi:hypothetical protein